MSRQSQHECHRCGAAVLPRIRGRPMSIAAFHATRISSASQASEVDSQLGLLDANITALDASIEAQEAKLLMLREKRHELDLSRDRHRGLTAPIRKIPAELLSEIFVYSTALGDFPDEWSMPMQVMMKLVLLWVCSTWRNIASSMSQFWTTIHLSDYGRLWHEDKLYRRTLNYPLLRHVWLPRSHQKPLTVDVDRPSEVTRGHIVFRTLLDLSRRWQSVSLALTSDEVHSLPRRLIMPRLTSLSLSARERERDEDEEEEDEDEEYLTSPIRIFSDAPVLQSVSLCDIPLDMVKLPRHQITSIELTGELSVFEYKLTVPRCLHFMRLYPNLRQFTCTVDDIGSHDIPQEVLLHTSLEAWKVSIDGTQFDGDVSLSFFYAITLPQLRELTVTVENPHLNVFWDQAVFMTFLTRSACKIRSLSLGEILIDGQDLLDMLSDMPTIESLSLNGAILDGGEWLFLYLTYSGELGPGAATTPPCLLPMLHDLRLHKPAQWTKKIYDGVTLAEMVYSRLLPEFTEITLRSDPSRNRARLRMLDMDRENYKEEMATWASHWLDLGLDVRCDGEPLAFVEK